MQRLTRIDASYCAVSDVLLRAGPNAGATGSSNGNSGSGAKSSPAGDDDEIEIVEDDFKRTKKQDKEKGKNPSSGSKRKGRHDDDDGGVEVVRGAMSVAYGAVASPTLIRERVWDGISSVWRIGAVRVLWCCLIDIPLLLLHAWMLGGDLSRQRSQSRVFALARQPSVVEFVWLTIGMSRWPRPAPPPSSSSSLYRSPRRPRPPPFRDCREETEEAAG